MLVSRGNLSMGCRSYAKCFLCFPRESDDFLTQSAQPAGAPSRTATLYVLNISNALDLYMPVLQVIALNSEVSAREILQMHEPDRSNACQQYGSGENCYRQIDITIGGKTVRAQIADFVSPIFSIFRI